MQSPQDQKWVRFNRVTQVCLTYFLIKNILTLLFVCLFSPSVVHPGGDRLRAGGPQPVRHPAAGQPADHPRHQAVRGPLFAGHLPQLPAGWLLWPEAAGPAQPHRSGVAAS